MNDVPGSGQPLRQPPGHPPHGHASAAQLPQPQGAGPRLIPTRALAIVTCVAVALVMAAYAVRGLLAPIVADKLDLMLASHSPVTLTPLHVFDWVNSWSGQLLLIAAVLTIIWLNLVRRNTEALSPKAFHERSAVWVTLGWVVPIVNLWFPFQVVRDIQHGLHPNPSVRRAPAVAGHLAGYWWFLSLAAFFALWIEHLAFASAWTVSAAHDDVIRYMEPTVGTLTTCAGVFWILIIVFAERNQATRLAQEQGVG